MIELTDADRAEIEHILGRDNLTWGQQCHAAYRAGIAAGIEQLRNPSAEMIEEGEALYRTAPGTESRKIGGAPDPDQVWAAMYAAAIRALNPPA
jgi:hypothetical protein